MQRTLKKYFFRTIALCSFMLVFGACLLAWRVFCAPVPLDFLLPYIHMALNQENGAHQFTLDHPTLQWSEEKQTLDLRLSVRMKTRSGETVAIAPKVLISFGLLSLSRGSLSPYAVEVWNSRLYLCRTLESPRGFFLPMQEERNFTEKDMENIFSMYALNFQKFAFKSIRFIKSSLTIDDQVLGLTWTATEINFELVHARHGLTMNGQCLVQTENGPIPVSLAVYHTYNHKPHIILTFSNVKFEIFSFLFKEKIPSISMPIAGTLSARQNVHDKFLDIVFFVTGGSGVITLPSVKRYAVRSLTLQGTIGSDLESLMLEKGTLDLGRPKISFVASLVSFQDLKKKSEQHLCSKTCESKAPLRSFLGRNLEHKKDQEQSDLGTRPSTLSNRHWAGDADITFHGLLVDDLVRYWPSGVAQSPRTWSVSHLRDGTVEQARFTATLGGAALTELTIERSHSWLIIRDVTIDYLKRMPPVRHTDTTVTFHPDWVEVQFNKGKIQNLHLLNADIMMTGLRKTPYECFIELTLENTFVSLLQFLRSSNLGAAEATLALQATQPEGLVSTRLALALPIVNGIELEQVQVRAQMQLSHLTLTSDILGCNLTDGTLILTIDIQKFHMIFCASIVDSLIRIDLKNFFNKRNSFRSRYIAHSCFSTAQRVALLGRLAVPFLIPPYMNGPVQTNLVASIGYDGLGTAAVEADLTATEIKSNIGWHKTVRKPGRATMTTRFTTSAIMQYAIPRFTIESQNVTLCGSVLFTLTGCLERLIFEHIQLGQTELTGVLMQTRTKDFILHMTGPALDLAPLLEAAHTPLSHITPHNTVRERANSLKTLPDIAVELTVARILGKQRGFLSAATLKARQQDGIWHGSLEALLGTQDTVQLSLISIKNTVFPTQVITVTSEKAGTVLQILGLFENMIGGRMRVNAVIDGIAERKIRGTIQVDDYRLAHTPLLARLLTMAALTGILESLTGDGIRFTSLDMGFVHYRSILSMAYLHTAGPSLGLTAMGRFFLRKRHLEICGTIVPIYFINSLMKNIPLFGLFMTNNGLISLNYNLCGSFTDPAITVNPLIAVIPSFLSQFFTFCSSYAHQREKSELDFSGEKI